MKQSRMSDTKAINVGDMVKITGDLGKGQIVKVEALRDLPMGTGVVVTLAGDYPATLNPANVEVVGESVGERWFMPNFETYNGDRESYIEELEAEVESERDRANRLALGYIALAEYTYGPKRFNAFPLVMKYHGETQAGDFAPVREQIDAEIAALPDYRDPLEDEDDEL